MPSAVTVLRRPAGALAVASAALLTGLLPTSPVRAAGVDVTVVDAADKPLAGAVIFLQPGGGKQLATRPLAAVEIAQAKRQFVPRVTIVTVGTPVSFPNLDTVRHHVFSFSPVKTFELKLYAGVPGLPVVFDKPGFAVLGCNIHDQMAAWVAVLDTPLYGLSEAGGRARLDGVPAGSYRLRAWHPGLAADAEPLSVALTVGAADVEKALRLDVTANPLATGP